MSIINFENRPCTGPDKILEAPGFENLPEYFPA